MKGHFPMLISTVVALAAGTPVLAADARWPGLAELVVAESCDGEPIVIRYDAKLASVDNTTVTDPDTGSKAVHALRARVAPDAPELVVDYWEGMSCDPTFQIHASAADRASGEPLFDQFGLVLVLPGDGTVYVSGHTNNYYDQTRKFVWSANAFREIEQPFFHVARATKALVAMELVAAPESTTVVTKLAPGDAATIAVCNKDDWCVVADRFGVSGWVKLEYLENGQFDGIRYAGD